LEVSSYESEVRIIKWRTVIENATNLYKIWYVEILEVADYEFKVRIIKFKMADEN